MATSPDKDREILALRSRLQSLEGKLKEAKVTIDKQKRTAEQHASEQAVAEQRKQKKKEASSPKSPSADQLKRELKTREDTIAGLVAERTRLEENIERLTRENDNKEAAAIRLKAQLEAANQQNQASRSTIDSLNHQLDALRKAMRHAKPSDGKLLEDKLLSADMQDALQAADARMGELSSQIHLVEQQAAKEKLDLINEIDQLYRKLHQARAELSRSLTTMEKKQEELERAQDSVRHLTAQAAQVPILQQQLARKDQDIQSRDQAIIALKALLFDADLKRGADAQRALQPMQPQLSFHQQQEGIPEGPPPAYEPSPSLAVRQQPPAAQMHPRSSPSHSPAGSQQPFIDPSIVGFFPSAAAPHHLPLAAPARATASPAAPAAQRSAPSYVPNTIGSRMVHGESVLPAPKNTLFSQDPFGQPATETSDTITCLRIPLQPSRKPHKPKT